MKSIDFNTLPIPYQFVNRIEAQVINEYVHFLYSLDVGIDLFIAYLMTLNPINMRQLTGYCPVSTSVTDTSGKLKITIK